MATTTAQEKYAYTVNELLGVGTNTHHHIKKCLTKGNHTTYRKLRLLLRDRDTIKQLTFDDDSGNVAPLEDVHKNLMIALGDYFNYKTNESGRDPLKDPILPTEINLDHFSNFQDELYHPDHPFKLEIQSIAGTSNPSNRSQSNAPKDSYKKNHSLIQYSSDTPAVTYDSGADDHYLATRDQTRAVLPILRKSRKRVRVANGEISHAENVTKLPFRGLSNQAAEAHTFSDFPESLLSVGKMCDDGTVSVFTPDGVTVHKEDDVLITVRGKPILGGVRDESNRYRIPLTQTHETWRPRIPNKATVAALQKASSVYDLPSIEQGIKWMHAVCGYPVKSTWLKAAQAGNFHGWPLITPANIRKYYPETVETPKGHMSQTRKNVRSTKAKPLEIATTAPLRGKKQRDVWCHVYDVRETVFSDQTGQFPKQSQAGHRYLMVLVDIDSSAILVEPLKSRKDAELIRAYRSIMTRLRRAGIAPRKHVLDNEVSEAMKTLITDEYKLQYELAPPGCHRRNAAEVAIRNFKAHFLSILAGIADDFPLHQWDKLLPQAEVTINLLRQSNANPKISAYAALNGPLFDYNKMPLAPMGGCRVQIHEKADQRGTWDFHSSTDGTSAPLPSTPGAAGWRGRCRERDRRAAGEVPL